MNNLVTALGRIVNGSLAALDSQNGHFLMLFVMLGLKSAFDFYHWPLDDRILMAIFVCLDVKPR